MFTCTIKFAIKVTMFFILKYWMLNVLNTFFVIFNLFYIKVVFKFFTILNEELNDSNIESLISGWRPRRIHFVYYMLWMSYDCVVESLKKIHFRAMLTSSLFPFFIVCHLYKYQKT